MATRFPPEREDKRDLGWRGTFLAIIATAALLYIGHLAITGTISHPLTYGFLMLFVAVATFIADFLVDRGILEKDLLIFYFVAVAGIVLLIVGAIQRGIAPLAYLAPLQEAAYGSALLYATIIILLAFVVFLLLYQKGVIKLPQAAQTVVTVPRKGRFVRPRSQ